MRRSWLASRRLWRFESPNEETIARLLPVGRDQDTGQRSFLFAEQKKASRRRVSDCERGSRGKLSWHGRFEVVRRLFTRDRSVFSHEQLRQTRERERARARGIFLASSVCSPLRWLFYTFLLSAGVEATTRE